jgi:hypothetical protein
MTRPFHAELLVALFAVACARPAVAPTPTPPPAPNVPSSSREAAKSFSCEVTVEALGASFEGKADGKTASTAGLEPVAEADACKKLLQETGIDCGDDARVLRSTTSSVRMVNGVGSASYVVRLTSVAAVQKGSARSDLGGREACLAAVATACQGAPAGSECTPKHVSCTRDASGKNWTCGPVRRKPLAGETLVAPDSPFSEP